jgi:hypothetical protein
MNLKNFCLNFFFRFVSKESVCYYDEVIMRATRTMRSAQKYFENFSLREIFRILKSWLLTLTLFFKVFNHLDGVEISWAFFLNSEKFHSILTYFDLLLKYQPL